MITVRGYEGARVGVLGLGRSGLAAARSLASGGAVPICWDDGEAARDAASAEGFAVEDLTKDKAWADTILLVVSPGVPHLFPKSHPAITAARRAGALVDNDVSLFFRSLAMTDAEVKVICITGSNGKSTTTALIDHILASCGKPRQMGGNIGRGVLDLDPVADGEFVVLELSSYQLDLARALQPDIAVFLNLSPDHLDRHGGMDGYQAAKMRIFQNQTEKDVAIIGFDDVITQSIAIGLSANGPARVVQASSTYALGRGVSAVDGRLYDSNSGQAQFVGNLSDCMALPGRHNHQNAAAAYAACRALGLDPQTIMDGIRTFPGLAHRLEMVGEIDGVKFVNDSKATNAEAAEQALKAYKKAYWIAGGVSKAEGIQPLAPLFPNITKAYLIGDSEETFAATLKGKVALQTCGTLENAVQAAFRDAKVVGDENPVILLSPACASFDQFRDFEHRGDVFRSIVQSMMPQELKELA